MIRLQESSGTPVKGVRLRSAAEFSKAEAANLVEEPLGKSEDLDESVLRPWETKTLLVQVK